MAGTKDLLFSGVAKVCDCGPPPPFTTYSPIHTIPIPITVPYFVLTDMVQQRSYVCFESYFFSPPQKMGLLGQAGILPTDEYHTIGLLRTVEWILYQCPKGRGGEKETGRNGSVQRVEGHQLGR